MGVGKRKQIRKKKNQTFSDYGWQNQEEKINIDKIERNRVKREKLQIKFLSKIQINPRYTKGIFICVNLS